MFTRATKDHNADKAAESAYNQVRTMLPGAPGHAQLMQLAQAHTKHGSKEEAFIREVINIGEILPISVEKIWLEHLGKHHDCVPIRAVAQYIFENHPEKLLGGASDQGSFSQFQSVLLNFWQAFRVLYPNHNVFERFGDRLKQCIPCKFHCDEGTGLRRSAVMQMSWGPVLAGSPNSFDRYFFWASMNGEQYKSHHAGYAPGNAVLDDLHAHLADQAMSIYIDGIFSKVFGRVHLCWIALEGDLPAQARVFRCSRHFSSVPNPCCFWCGADDRDIPYTDPSDQATWRGTVSQTRPWRSEGPLCTLGNVEQFLAKDLFHLCHLGSVRGFAINVLCYLVSLNHFVPCIYNINTEDFSCFLFYF